MQSGTFPCAQECLQASWGAGSGVPGWAACHWWLLSGDMRSQDWDLLDQAVGGQRKSQPDLCVAEDHHTTPQAGKPFGARVSSARHQAGTSGWHMAATPPLWSLPVHSPNLLLPRFHHRTLVSEWRGFSSAHLPVYWLSAASMNFTFVLLGMWPRISSKHCSKGTCCLGCENVCLCKLRCAVQEKSEVPFWNGSPPEVRDIPTHNYWDGGMGEVSLFQAHSKFDTFFFFTVILPHAKSVSPFTQT